MHVPLSSSSIVFGLKCPSSLQEFQLAFTRAKEQTEAREFFFGDIKTQFDEDRARLERFVFGHFLTSLSIMRMSSN